MERLLVSIGQEKARTESRARKRARDTPATSDPEPSSTGSTDVDELHPALAAAAVQSRFFNTVASVIDQQRDRRVESGKAFVARSSYALFMVVQAQKNFSYGPRWGALLYICFYLVSNAYADGPYSIDHSEGLCVLELKHVLNALGMGPGTMDPLDVDLMKQARKWSREEHEVLSKAIGDVWSCVADDEKVKRAVRAVLWPYQRAYLLFRGNA